MAETSGFFQAQWDESLVNPTTGEETGWWDKNYIAQQFADYFALFVGNGVFGSPTNQLKVNAGSGLNVTVNSGWGFIKGYWYHNDLEMTFDVPANSSNVNRTDSIVLRYNDIERSVSLVYLTGSTAVTRGDTLYDLQLATICVPSRASSISVSNITDKRTNQSVCGLVKGLMEVETTADLFAQYQGQFNDWFDDIKDQLVGDLAVRLQLEFSELNDKVDEYYTNTQDQVNRYQNNVQNQITQYKSDISTQILGYNNNYQQILSQTRQAAQTAQGQVTDYVDKDYVIAEQVFSFIDKICTISDSKVTANSLIDVYFTADTINTAEEAQITVDSSSGTITLQALQQPSGTIKGVIRVRVR